MKKKHKARIHKDHKGEFIYETYFMRGKIKRQKIYVVDGIPTEEFYKQNADLITIFQNGDYELLHEREMNDQEQRK